MYILSIYEEIDPIYACNYSGFYILYDSHRVAIYEKMVKYKDYLKRIKITLKYKYLKIISYHIL